MAKRFSGRVALVTGGARGIGKQIARAFAERGGNVALFDMNAKDLTAAADECKALGGVQALAGSGHGSTPAGHGSHSVR